MVPFQNALLRIYGLYKRISELRIGDWTYVGYPSSRFPFVGPTTGPFEDPVHVGNNGNVLVAKHGEHCVHSKQFCYIIGVTQQGGVVER